jgi:group I intron endonuclease
MNSTNYQEIAPRDIIKEIDKKYAKSACCGIYGLRNKITGKWYVGQSVNIQKRWHYGYELLHCKTQPKIYRALLKYGYNNFDTIVIEECQEVSWILDYRETFWIRQLNSIKNGYNLREGGHSGKMSEETKDKIALARTGKRWSDEHKKIISAANKKAQSFQVYKQKISDSWITRRLLGVSDKTRAKMTAAKLNQSEETCKKISESNRNRKHSEESKSKIREARKEYWRKKKLDKIPV